MGNWKGGKERKTKTQGGKRKGVRRTKGREESK